MLKELFDYYTTPCDSVFRKMGYLHELVGTASRANRVKSYWRSHLQNSKDVIEQAIRGCRAKRKVVILGAGNLLDIPLSKLAFVFSEVTLVDIVCSNAVRKACRRYANVKWYACDLTGVVLQLAENAKCTAMINNRLPKISESLPAYLSDCDLLVSANTLSQLACCPGKWLIKNNGQGTYIKQLAKLIVSSHIKSLRKVNAQVCLITDMQHRYLNRKGELIHASNIIDSEHTPVVPDGQWSWTIAPVGEINKNIQMISTVAAWINWL